MKPSGLAHQNPPGIGLLLAEARWPLEACQGLWALACQDVSKDVRSQPVLVIPGFGVGDASTWLLRTFLTRQGYPVFGWQQGVNLGTSKQVKARLESRVKALHTQHNAKVVVIGWSLGGIFARELGRQFPQHVAAVVSLASPFATSPFGNRLFPLAQRMSGKPFTDKDAQGFIARQTPPPVPTLAVHSRRDGIVHWQCSLEQPAVNTTNREVDSSHFGFVVNPSVLAEVAEFLKTLS